MRKFVVIMTAIAVVIISVVILAIFANRASSRNTVPTRIEQLRPHEGIDASRCVPDASSKHPRLARSPRSGHVYHGQLNSGEPFLYRFKAPVRIPVTSEQSNMVARVFAEIADAYANGDGNGMRTCMGNLPDVVTNMPDRLFSALSAPVREKLLNGFLNPRCILEFSSDKEFKLYVRNSIDLSVFWGNSYVKRDDMASPVAFIDTSVLRQLLLYKTAFHNSRHIEFEKCVDVFIDEWKCQIDSENGFTRQYMVLQVDLQWGLYNSGNFTLESLSAFVKEKANGLIKLGYTPKWLSEFDDLSEAVR